ncbi:MAG TPA: outer membrane beta-barrel protein [Vicinamibacterales bacterium]|nr:outer membrane beta-barrel protein [Vicinamibacterales bacterium]
MKALITTSILAIAVTLAPAMAQAQTPQADSAAVGVDVGIFFPKDDGLKSGLALDGFYEYYLSPRTSIRLGLGFMNPKIKRDEDDSIRYIRVGGDLVYNWEGGGVHPFVGAGVGAYFLQEEDNGDNFGDQEIKIGGNVFGGAEFFTSNTLSVKAEAKYHLISNVGAFNPDGLSLTIGLKKYF